MAWFRSFWIQWGTLCSLLFFLFAQDTSWDCRSKDELLTETGADADLPSECTLECTAHTYRRVLQSRDKPTVRFRDSYTENPEEYCWSMQRECSPEQYLHSAFVLLPVDATLESRAAVRLRVSSPARTDMLPQHQGRSLLPTDCGLRFDVTDLLRMDRGPVVCVKIVPEQLAREKLRCPPFLVMTWKSWNQGEG